MFVPGVPEKFFFSYLHPIIFLYYTSLPPSPHYFSFSFILFEQFIIYFSSLGSSNLSSENKKRRNQNRKKLNKRHSSLEDSSR